MCLNSLMFVLYCERHAAPVEVDAGDVDVHGVAGLVRGGGPLLGHQRLPGLDGGRYF